MNAGRLKKIKNARERPFREQIIWWGVILTQEELN